jgi:hypothetical protein
MYVIDFTTPIAAPPERCFDLSRSIEFHLRTSGETREEVIDGRRSGLIGLGETVRWRATHLGVRQTLTVRIAELEHPKHFRDEQVQGAFKHFVHDHWFEGGAAGGTLMRDRFVLWAPGGPLGWLAERLVVGPHLRRYLIHRAALTKQYAESEGWREFLTETRVR